MFCTLSESELKGTINVRNLIVKILTKYKSGNENIKQMSKKSIKIQN